MKYIIAVILLLSLTAEASKEKTLILELVRTKNSKALSRVALYTYEKDTKSYFSKKGPYELVINGITIPVNTSYLYELAQLKNSFNRNYRTKGIQVPPGGPVCAMAGPSIGRELNVLYNTYDKDDSYKVIKQEMKTVYSRGDSCIYTYEVEPKDPYSFESAVKAFGMLNAAYYLSDRQSLR